MIDLTIIAKESVTFLAPFLPYLLKAGEGAAEEAGKKLGEKAGGGAWEKATELWKRLSPKIEAKAEAKAAVEEVAAAPADDDAQGALRLQLKKLLAEDPDLAEEIALKNRNVKNAGVNVTVVGEGAVGIGGSANHSTIITGHDNTIMSD
jgi:hypothetical protein